MVIVLLFFLTVALTRSQVPPQLVLIPVGLLLLLPVVPLIRRRAEPREALLRWLGGFALEELVVGSLSYAEITHSAPLEFAASLLGSGGSNSLAGWGWGLYVASVGALVLVMARALPDWLFPVRGAWLRRMIAVLAVAVLFVSGPWLFLAWVAWRAFLPLTIVLGLDYAFYLWAAVRVISPLPSRQAEAP
jgi:hypothetical protein